MHIALAGRIQAIEASFATFVWSGTCPKKLIGNKAYNVVGLL